MAEPKRILLLEDSENHIVPMGPVVASKQALRKAGVFSTVPNQSPLLPREDGA